MYLNSCIFLRHASSNFIIRPHQSANSVFNMGATPNNKFQFRLATSADREEVREALANFFYPDETITISYYNGSEVTEDDMEYALALIDEGYVMLAVDEETGKIAGLSGGAMIEHDQAEKTLEFSKQADTKKFADILLFTAHMCKNADVFQRFGVDRSYHIYCCGVDPQFRGLSLAFTMAEKQLDVARSLGFKIVSTDATGVHSARLCQKLDMECVYTLAYSDFRDDSGQQLFSGMAPHFEAKTFVKHL